MSSLNKELVEENVNKEKDNLDKEKEINSKYINEDERDYILEEYAEQREKLNLKKNVIETLEYDSDDNPIIKKRLIDSLEPLNHEQIQYEFFEKNFYEVCEEINCKSDQEIVELRRKFNIRIQGTNVPRPITSFDQLGFDQILLKNIKKQGFVSPTPIQIQTLPIALSGKDLIAIAQTGSGKTVAYLLPLITHIMDQREVEKDEGPIAIIVAPTRELAHQIYNECRKFSKGYTINIAPIIGGMGKNDTKKMLKTELFDIVVATPGRLIDVLKVKSLNTIRTTYLVLDEADKMFEMGFEPQIRSIVGQIRPDRQTLLFSATFKPPVENLAREILTDPIRINIGTAGSANEDITQVVEIFNSDEEKFPWMAPRLAEWILDGFVLIFAGTKSNVENLSLKIKNTLGIACSALHGDKSTEERNRIMQEFKSGIFKVLVATDIAARGLDVKEIKTVVNYNIPNDIDAHTHRIGRTGRAGDKNGIAYSLLKTNESHFAGLLINNLQNANQDIPPELVELAMKNPKFRTKSNILKRGQRSSRGRRMQNNSLINNENINKPQFEYKESLHVSGNEINQNLDLIQNNKFDFSKNQFDTKIKKRTPKLSFIKSSETYSTLDSNPTKKLYDPFK